MGGHDLDVDRDLGVCRGGDVELGVGEDVDRGARCAGKRTPVTCVNPFPVTSTRVPPDVLPEDGATDRTEGAWTPVRPKRSTNL